ncbi:transcription termination/antitermination protein NusG [candidate division SR1 bacterium]|nr:transcription termination/antitermination protein NusG [candidate division SR1 bacterium]
MASTTTVEIKKQIEDRDFKRYVLSVTAGQEDLVVKNLQERIKKQKLDEDVIEFLNPKVNEASIKKGEKIVKQKKLFPGYLFFKSRMNDHIWYVVRNTPGVRLIVGAETRPVPLTEKEYQDILTQINQSQERSEMTIPYKIGDLVLIKQGDLKGTQGPIKEIDSEKGVVVVQVEFLGQITPVVIDLDKIELL